MTPNGAFETDALTEALLCWLLAVAFTVFVLELGVPFGPSL